MSDHIFQPTEIVLAKVKGYSAWPSMIVPTEIIPPTVLKLHPAESLTPLEDSDTESDPGYIHYSSVLSFKKFSTIKDIYCVKFFCDDSYIWVKHRDLLVLTERDCEVWLNSSIRKNKKLIPAYKMAMKGLVTKNGIDVWEFVEYGSNGKNDDEDYVSENDYDEDTKEVSGRRSKRNKKNPTRSSSRQRSKRQKKNEVEEEVSTSRRTRSRNTGKQEEEEEEEIEELDGLTAASTRGRRGIPPKNVKSTSKSKTVTKVTAKAAAKPKPKPKPKVIKYNYEDDEDWSVVGMGPQDISVDQYVSPLVKKLSQKKNFDKHNELRLDLDDRIVSINKLIFDLFSSNLKDEKSVKKNDLEIILDELDIAISMRGSHGEFISIFRSNNELLFNFRLLFNMKEKDLKNWSLWDGFQRIFKQIYDHEIIVDLQSWTTNPIVGDQKINELQTTPKVETS